MGTLQGSRPVDRRLSALVVLALVSTVLSLAATVSPASALTQPGVLNLGAITDVQTVVSSRGGQYNRDGGYTVRLPDGKVLWIFADTMKWDEATGVFLDGTILGTSAIGSTTDPAVVTENLQPNGKFTKLLLGAVETCPAGKSPFAWPTSATGVPQADPNKLLIVLYYTALCGSPGVIPPPKHMGVATFLYDAANPTAQFQATVLTKNLFGLEPRYGQTAVYSESDGYLYVYGCAGTPCRVARVLPTQVGTIAAYRYWDGTGWSADPGAAAPVDSGGHQSPSPQVEWFPSLNRYVAMNWNGGKTFRFRMATSPTGPWSADSELQVPECTKVCMTPALHPVLSDNTRLRFSYGPLETHDVHLATVELQVQPVGQLESVTPGINQVRVQGWAIDPDTTASVLVGVFVDGVAKGLFNAKGVRPDIAAQHPAYGPDHGFDVTVPVTPGTHEVCVTAVNQGLGSGITTIGCATVDAFAPPGAPQSVVVVGGDTEALVMWQPPVDGGGAPVGSLTYEVTPVPPVAGAPFTASAGASSLLVGGLTNGVAYTFEVRAANTQHVGPPASASPVTPAPTPGTAYHPIAPTRFLDSRTGLGFAGKVAAGTPRELQITGRNGIPASATAVVMNVAVTGSTANSFLTAFPAGQLVPTAANLNFAAGQTTSNLVTVRIGAGGKVALFNAVGSTDVIVDVTGWYDDGTGAGALFNPIAPARFLDSRNGTGWTGKVAAGAPRELQVTGVSGVPAGATAVVLNVAVTESNADSFLTAFPAGQAVPTAANLNFAAGQTTSNLVTVKVGAGGRVAFATGNGATHVVADVTGWYDDTAGNRFHTLLGPTRILDDRNGTGGFTTPIPSNLPRAVQVAGGNGVPGSAVAVVANVAVTGSTADSYLTVFPAGQPVPLAANLNFAKGETKPNLVISKLGFQGRIGIATAIGQTSVIVDAAGYFSPT